MKDKLRFIPAAILVVIGVLTARGQTTIYYSDDFSGTNATYTYVSTGALDQEFFSTGTNMYGANLYKYYMNDLLPDNTNAFTIGTNGGVDDGPALIWTGSRPFGATATYGGFQTGRAIQIAGWIPGAVTADDVKNLQLTYYLNLNYAAGTKWNLFIRPSTADNKEISSNLHLGLGVSQQDVAYSGNNLGKVIVNRATSPNFATTAQAFADALNSSNSTYVSLQALFPVADSVTDFSITLDNIEVGLIPPPPTNELPAHVYLKDDFSVNPGILATYTGPGYNALQLDSGIAPYEFYISDSNPDNFTLAITTDGGVDNSAALQVAGDATNGTAVLYAGFQTAAPIQISEWTLGAVTADQVMSLQLSYALNLNYAVGDPWNLFIRPLNSSGGELGSNLHLGYSIDSTNVLYSGTNWGNVVVNSTTSSDFATNAQAFADALNAAGSTYVGLQALYPVTNSITETNFSFAIDNLELRVLTPQLYLTNSWNGSQLTLSWPAGALLLEATNVLGPWMTNTSSSPLILTPSSTAQKQEYFQLLQPGN